MSHGSRNERTKHWTKGGLIALLLCFAFLTPDAGAREKEYANDDRIGIDEQLGATVPLDLPLRGEDGLPVTLRELVDRPTILMLVYYGCPGICSPLMHEVARRVEGLEDMALGVDFNIVTVSFDDTEGPKLAGEAKEKLLKDKDGKWRVPPDAWRFLTAERDAIVELTDAVGFRFRKEKGEFVHAGTVIFLTKEGKIARYLAGLEILPADLKLAIIDATEGRARSFLQKIQKLCFGYDPEKKTYKLLVNRIVLGGTVFLLLVFLLFLILFRRKKPAPAAAAAGEALPESNET